MGAPGDGEAMLLARRKAFVFRLSRALEYVVLAWNAAVGAIDPTT